MEQSGHMTILRELLETQLLAVLGTHHQGEPHASLVGFAASPDLRMLYFATGRATRKHADLAADARASMLIDNCSRSRWARSRRSASSGAWPRCSVTPT